MDAEVVSAGILREAFLAGVVSMEEIETQIGSGVAHLLRENVRINDMHSEDETLDDEEAGELRKRFLTCFDIRALILELAFRLDTMGHLDDFPKYHQKKLSLEALKIYAPLAHAVGATALSLELEDLSFRRLFPSSYLYLDTWLRTRETESRPLLEVYRDHLLQSLKSDAVSEELANEIKVKGRYKSRFSTMKKLLRDGGKPEKLHDILGLRVIIDPKDGDTDKGNRGCYRALELIRSFWKEVPTRTKDYIAKPKKMGYRSLHVVVDLSDQGPLVIPMMEIQIRTVEMDTFANASHKLYKGGLTDPEEEKRLKETMLAAAEVTALHLKDLPAANQKERIAIDPKSQVFRFIDENGDGRISVEELTAVMEELGAGGKDAMELMQLLDANNDGFLSPEEFELLQKQVGFMRNMEDTDDLYRTVLGEKFQAGDGIGMIHVYRRELSDKLAEAAA